MEITPHRLNMIRALMAGKRWTDSDLASASQLARSTIWRILKGKQKMMDPPTVKAFCVALGVTESELAGDQDHHSGAVRESSGHYSLREDPLAAFIRVDLLKNPTHRPAYESIATAFGYTKTGGKL